MISGVEYGFGFRGMLQYALGKDGAYQIGPVRGDEDELCQGYAAFRALNEKALNPVLHLWISLHPNEHLDDQAWETVVETMMTGLGYRDHFYVAVRHRDTDHEHVHIIGSRIGPDGRFRNVWRERRKASAIAARLEKRYGLIEAALRWDEQPGARRQARLRTLIEEAANRGGTVSKFVARLEAAGVGVKANIAGGHVSGISFWHEGRLIKGSALGRAFSWSRLLKRLDYAPGRDLPRLILAAERTESVMAAWRARAPRLGRPGAPWRWEGQDLLGMLGRLARRTGKALSRESRRGDDVEDEDRDERREPRRR